MSLKFEYFLDQIEYLSAMLKDKFGLVARMGAEIEFYLRGESSAIVKVVRALEGNCMRVETEKGWHQHECVFSDTDDLIDLAEQINDIKMMSSMIARREAGRAIFEAKPFESDYGSALHIHISLHDQSGFNVFSEASMDDNHFLQNCIGGILDITPEMVYLLCRHDSDYERFMPEYMAPTHISWGGNNRTTVVRIPDSKPENRRIEYRLPPASADPACAIALMLIGIIHGLTNKIKAPSRTYGNAFDEQYNLPELPKTPEQAKNAFEKNGKILHYIRLMSPEINLDL